MKLYATTTSERASKGQGGNDFIQIKLVVGDKNNQHEIGIVSLTTEEDGEYKLTLDRSSYGRKNNSCRVYNETIKS